MWDPTTYIAKRLSDLFEDHVLELQQLFAAIMSSVYIEFQIFSESYTRPKEGHCNLGYYLHNPNYVLQRIVNLRNLLSVFSDLLAYFTPILKARSSETF